MKLGELVYHCSFIGLKYADFNSQCISNVKRLFYGTLWPKIHGQVCLDRKCYQGSLLVLFIETTPASTTATYTFKQISSPQSNVKKDFATKLLS